MKKKRFKWIIIIIIFIPLFVYLFMTPIGSLRLAIFLKGHPIQAITTTMEFESKPFIDFHEENKQMYTFVHPPYLKETNGYYYNWIVKKIGCFYYAYYYGEG